MSKKVDQLFKAFADPTRREIFHVLVVASAALSITQISEHFDMTRQGVTKHIKALQQVGLVNIKPEGRESYCFPNPEPLKEIKDWIAYYEKFWDDKLAKLDAHLNKKSTV